jgi:hypothetical protein
MNPQEGSPRVPFCQYAALEEPRCRSFMSCFPNEVLIRRRVRGREPVLNLPSQLFTYKITSISATKRTRNLTNVSSCLFRLTFGEEQLRPQVSTADTGFTRKTYSNPVGYYPMTPCHLTESVQNDICEHTCRISHLPKLPSHYPQDYEPHPMSVQQLSEPRPGLIDPIFGERPRSRSPPITFL